MFVDCFWANEGHIPWWTIRAWPVSLLRKLSLLFLSLPLLLYFQKLALHLYLFPKSSYMALVCSVFVFVTHFFYLQWFALYFYFFKDYCISTSLLCLYICHTFLVLLVLPFFASGNPYLPNPANLSSFCICIKDENDLLNLKEFLYGKDLKSSWWEMQQNRFRKMNFPWTWNLWVFVIVGNAFLEDMRQNVFSEGWVAKVFIKWGIVFLEDERISAFYGDGETWAGD